MCEDNWYSFPKYKPTIYNQFATCVVPLFKKLKNRVIINQAINKNIKQPIHLEYLQEIHELVARFDVEYQYLGKWRTDDVLISGTNWRPKCPDVKKMHFELNRYLDNPFITDRAIRTGLWIMRTQPFKDGNKRVGSFIINKILIENGKGIFNVPIELEGTFKQMLVNYYESDDSDILADWIAKNCLQGTTRADSLDSIEVFN